MGLESRLADLANAGATAVDAVRHLEAGIASGDPNAAVNQAAEALHRVEQAVDHAIEPEKVEVYQLVSKK